MSEWEGKTRGQDTAPGGAAEQAQGAEHPLGRLHPDPRVAMALYRRIKLKKQRAQSPIDTSDPTSGPPASPGVPNTGGRPLDDATRGRLEPHVGGDLSAVKVHTGQQSEHAADALGAQAFADGANLHFAKGEFAPGTKEGDRLLAHEATHALQQHEGVRLARDPRTPDSAGAHDPAEAQADAVGDRTAEALHGPTAKKIAGPDIAKLSKAGKIFEAMRRAGPYIGPAAAAKIEALVTPEALETLTLVLAGGAVLQAIPVVGQVADAGLAAWAIYSLGEEALHVGKEVFAFLRGAISASSPAELDVAGRHFANFVAVVTVDGAVAFLLHKASKDISREVNRGAKGLSDDVPRGPNGMAPAIAGGPAAGPAAAAGYRVLADGTIVRLSGAAAGSTFAMSQTNDAPGGGHGPASGGGSSGTAASGSAGGTGGNRLIIPPGRTMSAQETAVANQLVAEGHTVEALAESDVRTADFLVDGVRTELKTISNISSPDPSGALARRILDGAGQASNIILDLRAQAGMTEELAQRAVRRAFGADRASRLRSVRLLGAGFDVTVPR